MASYWDKLTKERLARRRLLKSGAALSVGAAALALVGCGDDDDDDDGGGAASPTAATGGGGGGAASPTAASGGGGGGGGGPQQGGRLGRRFGSVTNENPVQNYHKGYNIDVVAYDRLVYINNFGTDSRFTLAAAASYEQPDDLTAIFTLKPGMVFQDKAPVSGRAVTAADVKASQEYVRDFELADNNYFQTIVTDTVEATDDTTVVFHFKQPTAYLFSLGQLGHSAGQHIIAPEMIDSLDDSPPIGSGPFQYVSSTFNTNYLFERNPTFRGAADNLPYIDEREMFGLSDAVAIEAALISGQIHLWDPAPNSAVTRLQGELGGDFSWYQYLNAGLVGFDARQGLPPFNDVRVREAFYRLTVKQQFIDLAENGLAQDQAGPLHGFILDYQLDFAQTEDYYRHDVAEAVKLLEAAEFDLNREWEVIHSDSGGASTLQLNEIWAQQLGEAGIKLQIVPLPLGVLLPERMATGNFELIHTPQPGGDTPFRALRNNHSDTTDIFNNSGLFLPEIDAKIEQSETMTNYEEQVQFVKDLEIELLDLYTLAYPTHTRQSFDFFPANLHYTASEIGGAGYTHLDAWFES